MHISSSSLIYLHVPADALQTIPEIQILLIRQIEETLVNLLDRRRPVVVQYLHPISPAHVWLGQRGQGFSTSVFGAEEVPDVE